MEWKLQIVEDRTEHVQREVLAVVHTGLHNIRGHLSTMQQKISVLSQKDLPTHPSLQNHLDMLEKRFPQTNWSVYKQLDLLEVGMATILFVRTSIVVSSAAPSSFTSTELIFHFV